MSCVPGRSNGLRSMGGYRSMCPPDVIEHIFGGGVEMAARVGELAGAPAKSQRAIQRAACRTVTLSSWKRPSWLSTWSAFHAEAKRMSCPRGGGGGGLGGSYVEFGGSYELGGFSYVLGGGSYVLGGF